MIKPKSLKKGDKVATISLSWGGAGDKNYRYRYEIGKKRIEKIFGLNVIEMPNSLKGSQYLSKHPEARADEKLKKVNIGRLNGYHGRIKKIVI